MRMPGLFPSCTEAHRSCLTVKYATLSLVRLTILYPNQIRRENNKEIYHVRCRNVKGTEGDTHRPSLTAATRLIHSSSSHRWAPRGRFLGSVTRSSFSPSVHQRSDPCGSDDDGERKEPRKGDVTW